MPTLLNKESGGQNKPRSLMFFGVLFQTACISIWTCLYMFKLLINKFQKARSCSVDNRNGTRYISAFRQHYSLDLRLDNTDRSQGQ